MSTTVRSDVHITPVQIYVLVGCIAAATMGLELVQTRILSFLYYNNVVYLTVTIALLGLGISGVLVSVLSERIKNRELIISLFTLGFVFSSILCLCLVSRIPEYFQSNEFKSNKLLISYMLLLIPFLFSGATLGWIFMTHAKSINRLYGIDLVCSSIAVITFVFLLCPLGADWFLWLCSGIVLASFLFYNSKVLSKFWLVFITLSYVGLFVLFNGNLLGKYPESYKTLGEMYKKGEVDVEQTYWTPITRIDLSSTSYSYNILSFNSTDIKVLTQDATAAALFLGPRIVADLIQEIPKGRLLRAIALIYNLKENAQSSLVIGVGGGLDMLTAKLMGAKHVTGVEINPATVKLVTGPYRDYVQWPNWDGVKIVQAEGRNYVHSKSNQFDTIVMTGIDTFSALNSGAYVLSENYLYTVEAVKDYLQAIKPDGVVGIYRWLFVKPRETLRLASIYVKAAEDLKIAHPEQSIMVISDDLGWGTWGATFFKKTPYTPAEVNQILSLVEKNPTLSIVYLPKVFPKQQQREIEVKMGNKYKELDFARMSFNKLIDATPSKRNQFIQDYPFRIDPVFDNRPFFFEYYKDNMMQEIPLETIRSPTVLYHLLFICSIFCFFCILLPLWVFQSRGLKTPGVIPVLLYFSCLGFGFMMFEIGAMQFVNVYIGDPMYSLSIVLSGLLISTGIGSMISAKISAKFLNFTSVTLTLCAMLAVAVMIFVWRELIAIIQPLTMNYSLLTRSCIILISLLPLGIFMGIPFPTAIREIDKYYPPFIAWAWGINGVTSVLASVAAIIIAMKFGFSMTIIVAAITYLMGLVLYWMYYKILARSTESVLIANEARQVSEVLM